MNSALLNVPIAPANRFVYRKEVASLKVTCAPVNCASLKVTQLSLKAADSERCAADVCVLHVVLAQYRPLCFGLRRKA